MITTENKVTFTIQDLKRADKPLETAPYRDILERLIETYEKEEYIDVGYPRAFKKNADFKHGLITHNSVGESLVNWGRHSFFYGLFSAYAHHRPIVLSPDIIWQLIIQGFSYHVEFNAEKLRRHFVDFDGKLTLVIRNDKLSLNDAQSPWEEIFPALAQKIRYTFGKDLVDTITADFSTTTATERIASQITLMHSVKSFVEFLVMVGICGIPEVTLEGTPEDWEAVLKKAENLKKYDLNWWIDALRPVLQEFIQTAKGEIDRNFWKNIITHKSESCGLDEFDGWIINFFPYDKDGKRLDLKILTNPYNLPNEIVKVPVKYIEEGEHYDLEVWSGFVGLEQNEKTMALKPQIGWLIRQTEDRQKKFEKRYSIMIRVKTIPDEILELQSIPSLRIDFIGKINIPEKFYAISINYLTLKGEISNAQIFKVWKRFPKTTVRINNVEYPKGYFGFFLVKTGSLHLYRKLIFKPDDYEPRLTGEKHWHSYWKIRDKIAHIFNKLK